MTNLSNAAESLYTFLKSSRSTSSDALKAVATNRIDRAIFRKSFIAFYTPLWQAHAGSAPVKRQATLHCCDAPLLKSGVGVEKKSCYRVARTSFGAGVAPAEVQRLSRGTVSSTIAMAVSRRATQQESARSAHTFQHTPPCLAIPDLHPVAFQFEGTRLVSVGEIRR